MMPDRWRHWNERYQYRVDVIEAKETTSVHK